VGPNFSLELCAEVLIDEETDDLDLSSVRQLYCGAEPIHAETQARFLQTAAPFGFDPKALIPCYGMAEATLFISGKRSDSRYGTAREPERSGNGRIVVSCGEVDSEHAVRIVDPATCARLDEGVVGEIWVSGRSVAAGYYKRPDVTREVFHARLPGDECEYLRTGDLGFTQAGELFVTGRIKDLIIVDGRNIYPQDVEAAVVRTDPAFRKAVAFSIDGNSTEQLCVVVEAGYLDVTPQRYSTMVDAIRRGVTSEFGVRPHVHICPKRTIPVTTSGKVRRQEARRMFLANALRPLQIDPLPRREAVG